MAKPDPRFTEARMLTHVGHALTKIDEGGPRGVERVTHQEIEAMASALVLFGLRPIRADQFFPEPVPVQEIELRGTVS